MEADIRVSRALEDLKRATGLKLSLDEVPEGREEETAERIASLAAAYRGRNDRAGFLRNLLCGEMTDTETSSGALRLHLAEQGKRILYVVELWGGDMETAGKVLRQMFVSGTGDFLVNMGGRRLALIRNADRKDSEEEHLRTAHTIADMLSTEALIPANVAYTETADSLQALPEAYRNAVLALTIGKTFYTNETVFRYSTLGIGRLIYDLPEESCRMFLRERFGDGSPDDFDAETADIINALFENNLNISEAARQLYLHRNTLVYRLEKLHQSTGFDLRKFDDAVSLKLAMMISKKLNMTDNR